MKAVIPCAKKEENLFPFIESAPTGLLPVAGKPVVKHLIEALKDAGIDDIYLVANYRQKMFESEFGEYTDVNIVRQEELNGTGGAVETCDFIEEDFLVVNGDVVISGQDIEALVKKHEQKNPGTTILATREEKPEKFGVLSIENDRVVDLVEKPEEPENTLVNTGIYVFTPAIFEELEKMEGEKDLTDAVKMFLGDEARFELVEDYWIDIGSPRKLWEADRIKRERMVDQTSIAESAEIHEDAEICDEAVIREDAELKPGTVLEGACIIGENAEIGPDTTVTDSSVNAGTVVRSAAVEDSLIFRDVSIEPSVFVQKSVLAEETSVKAGTVISESFIGPRSFIEMNNSIKGVKFVPDARTDLSEISK
ncbi:MAG: sugar phosphate nucleotidyltransferase [Candidatus Nanohaloarchaea archaeon]